MNESMKMLKGFLNKQALMGGGEGGVNENIRTSGDIVEKKQLLRDLDKNLSYGKTPVKRDPVTGSVISGGDDKINYDAGKVVDIVKTLRTKYPEEYQKLLKNPKYNKAMTYAQTAHGKDVPANDPGFNIKPIVRGPVLSTGGRDPATDSRPVQQSDAAAEFRSGARVDPTTKKISPVNDEEQKSDYTSRSTTQPAQADASFSASDAVANYKQDNARYKRETSGGGRSGGRKLKTRKAAPKKKEAPQQGQFFDDEPGGPITGESGYELSVEGPAALDAFERYEQPFGQPVEGYNQPMDQYEVPDMVQGWGGAAPYQPPQPQLGEVRGQGKQMEFMNEQGNFQSLKPKKNETFDYQDLDQYGNVVGRGTSTLGKGMKWNDTPGQF